jgi:hypothetical protein
MSFAVDRAQPLVLALLLLVVLLVLTVALVARPWRSGRPGFGDRFRIGAAVLRYDLWLELRGLGRRRRRDLCEELRANLDDAAERVGAARAVAALGSLRRMSAEAAAGTATGPRWSAGATAAGCALAVVAAAELLAIIAWTAAADASGAARVQGPLPLFPGSLATWERTGSGLSIALEPGWLVFAAVAVAFVLGSRPWLAGSAQRRGAPV